MAADNLITEKQLAAMLGLSLAKLRADRCMGRGVPYLKFGDHRSGPVRYRMSDVEAYLESCRVVPIHGAPRPVAGGAK